MVRATPPGTVHVRMNHTRSKEDITLALDEDIPYTRRSVRNLQFHQPVQVIVLKAVFGISVKKSLEIDECRTISAVMHDVKNMIDYRVSHHVRQVDVTYDHKKNIIHVC